MRTLRLLLAAALATSGCGARQSTHIDGGVLGRVVVYRNGVAFYERTARVVDGKVTVHVPRERVDDFLKSLTVVDARTQKPLMVTIPRQQSSEGQFLEMTLETPEVAIADVLLTYVTESPAWKPSYRVVVGKDDKVMLEGWAIVDNTTSEDWKGVLVGVGASSALAFRYDLWSVRSVDRDLLAGDDRFAISPPTALSPYERDGAEVLGSISGSAPLENTYAVVGVNTSGRTFGATGGEAITISGSAPTIDISNQGRRVTTKQGARAGFGGFDGPPPRRPDVEPPSRADAAQALAASDAALVKRVLAQKNEIILELHGRAGDEATLAKEAQQVASRLVDAGMPATKVHIVPRLGETEAVDVRVLSVAPSGAAKAKELEARASRPRDLGPDTPVGESHFMADRPMTVRAGTSAMVSMVRSETMGGVVYLYDPISARGDQRFAFKAVRLDNPTAETLEPGPVTVYGDGRFIGEGITEAVLPHASVVVPFALDKQVIVDRVSTEEDRLAKIVTVQRGVMTAEVQHRRHATFKVTSRSSAPTRVYLRHHLEEGWTLIEAPAKFTRVGGDQLFEVDLAPNGSATVTIAEATPVERTLELQSEAAIGMMRVFVEDPAASPALRAQLAAVLATHQHGAELTDKIETLREQLAEYRARGGELDQQLVSLKGMRSSLELAASLRQKAGEISQHVQATTLAVVNTQEQLMVTRVKLANQLADLRLTDVTKPAVSAR